MEKTSEMTLRENSPAEMIRMAVSGGADLSKLEQLLGIQERYEANEARKAYHKAMAAFKANPPRIEKDRKVAYGNTKYNHASLANVVDKISAELSKHGLSASWTTKQNGVVMVTCKITHIQGHSEETTLSAAADNSGSKNSIQAIGSTITYLERYTLLALTGLATEDMDDDGKAAGVDDRITPEQVAIINKNIADLKIEPKKFLDFMKLDKVEDMLAVEYPKAMAAFEAKRRKAQEGVKVVKK